MSCRWVCGSSREVDESKRNIHLPDAQHPSTGLVTGLFEVFRDLPTPESQNMRWTIAVLDWTREAQRWERSSIIVRLT